MPISTPYRLDPAGRDEIRVMGQYLKAEDGQKQDPKGKIMVAINHKRTDAAIDPASWEKDHVTLHSEGRGLTIDDKARGRSGSACSSME